MSGRRSFLVLQGLATHFFVRLGDALAARGHAVHRVNFNGGDRLCQCQDWGSRSFPAKIINRRALEPDFAGISAAVYLGHGARRTAVLRFRREDTRWLLDDMISDEFPDTLKAAIRQTIAENEASRKAVP